MLCSAAKDKISRKSFTVVPFGCLYICMCIYNFTYLFIYFSWLYWFFLVAWVFSLAAASRGYSLAAVGSSLWWPLLLWCTGPRARGLQWLWHEGSAVAAHGLESTGSIILAHGLSYYMSSGIFPDQGSNPRLLHWQADSLPLSHQGSLSFDHFLLDFQWTACSHSFVSLLVLCI